MSCLDNITADLQKDYDIPHNQHAKHYIYLEKFKEGNKKKLDLTDFLGYLYHLKCTLKIEKKLY